MTNSTAKYFKYANLQMAAESLFGWVPGLVPGWTSTFMDKASLVIGNHRSSLFTEVQADLPGSEGWTVLEHKSDTATGFSGTLFRNKNTGELVLSFRSTEFADDAARDNQATNKLEISEEGWAFGQISDMESWYASLLANGKISADDKFTVTGYSLGGHLATAFNLLRQEDGTSSRIAATYTFNGAGVGNVVGTTLTQVIQEFRQVRDFGAIAQFRTVEGQGLYLVLSARLGLHPDAAALAQGVARVRTELRIADALHIDDFQLLLTALTRAQSVAEERDRVATLTNEGGTRPVPTDLQAIDAVGLDYQLAVLVAARNTNAYPASDLGDPESGVYSTLYDRRNVAPIRQFGCECVSRRIDRRDL